jgi:hypothetical protein
MFLVICIDITNTVSTVIVTPIRIPIRAARSSAHPPNDAVYPYANQSIVLFQPCGAEGGTSAEALIDHNEKWF